MSEEKLTGKTMLVYMYVLSKNRVTAREVKNALGFSSTSLAIYYLDRLYQMDLVDKEPGGYYVLKKKVDLGFYGVYRSLYGILLPKFLPYALFFTLLLIFYFFFYIDRLDLYALISLIAAASIFWYETIVLYLRMRTIYKNRKLKSS
ncbi:MAG TPA: hypothetical protein VKU94_07010 [Geobacterales bacterium]|nr:hypothetical protein [Geobacterales bacterium]